MTDNQIKHDRKGLFFRMMENHPLAFVRLLSNKYVAHPTLTKRYITSLYVYPIVGDSHLAVDYYHES